MLEHKLELEALLPAFDSTDGTYMWPKYEGNRLTNIRELTILIFHQMRSTRALNRMLSVQVELSW